MRLAAAFAVLATPAIGQSCFPYDQLQAGMATEELALSFSGMTGDESGLVQIYTHPDGRWIVVQVSLDGKAWMLSGGQQSRVFEREPLGEES